MVDRVGSVRLRKAVWMLERKMKQIIFVSAIGMLALARLLWFPQVSRAQIPASYFGIHTSNLPGDFPLKVKYGNFRNLPSGQVWWHINTCDPPHSPADCQSNPAANIATL
jgi:hypothetical protein